MTSPISTTLASRLFTAAGIAIPNTTTTESTRKSHSMDREIRASSMDTLSTAEHPDGQRPPHSGPHKVPAGESTVRDPLDLVIAKRKRKELADPVIAEAIRTASKLPPPRIPNLNDHTSVPQEIQQLIDFGVTRRGDDEATINFLRNYSLHTDRTPLTKPVVHYPVRKKHGFRRSYLDAVFHVQKRRDVDDGVKKTGKEETKRSHGFVHSDEDWFMENVLHVICILLIILTLPLSLIFCLKVVAHYERAVLFRLGRLVSATAKGPGLIVVLPCLDRYRILDLRTFTFDVPTQEVLTKDSVTVVVNAVVYYRVRDPVRAVVNVEDANRATRVLGQTTLRNVLGTVNLDQLLTAREDIAALMQECFDSVTEAWGVKVERVEIKDVRLPIQLQRAMAAEAESVREATAKVIAAEGEMRASSALKAAACEIGQNPIALQLRYLQALNSISSGKESTIIFPVPLDLLSLFRIASDHMIRPHSDKNLIDLDDEPDDHEAVEFVNKTSTDFTGEHFATDNFEPSQIV